eukprot:11210318-Lingulodinium_polyedra.AAC.1
MSNYVCAEFVRQDMGAVAPSCKFVFICGQMKNSAKWIAQNTPVPDHHVTDVAYVLQESAWCTLLARMR